MKVLLVFPPSGDVFQPYISITHLTAVLMQEGIAVEQRDLNIEFMHHFTSLPLIKATYKKLEAFLAEFEQQSEASVLDAACYRRYAPYRDRKEKLMKIAPAKAQLRNTFDCYRTTADAISLLEEILQLNSFPYFPVLVRLSKGCNTGPYSYERESDIIAFAGDRGKNPYLPFFKEVVSSLVGESPGIIGISVCFNTQVLPAFTLAQVLRDSGFPGHICVGGPAVTQIEARLSNAPRLMSFFDSAVFGEGEYALGELLEAVGGKREFRQVSNLLYWDETRTNLLRSPGISYVKDMDRLPPPSLKGLPMESYLSPETVLLYSPTRGCYWSRCAFCSYGLTAGTTAQYRERSPERVVDDLEYLHNLYGIRYFTFSVDCISPITLARISQEIIKRRLSIWWQVDLRLEPALTPERIRLFARAGCVSIMFGLESACQRILDIMDKGIKPDVVQNILAALERSGIASVLMVFLGFPTETEAEAGETRKFLIKNSRYITSIGLGIFGLLRNCLVSKYPAAFGVTLVSQPGDEGFVFDYTHYTVSAGISPKKKTRVFTGMYRKLAKYYPLDFYPFRGQGQSAHTLLWLQKHGAIFAKKLLQKERPLTGHSRPSLKEGDILFNKDTVISLSPDVELVTSPFDLLSFPLISKSIDHKKLRKMQESRFVIPKLEKGKKLASRVREGDYYRVPGTVAGLLQFLKKPVPLRGVLDLTSHSAVKDWLQKCIASCGKNRLLVFLENPGAPPVIANEEPSGNEL